MVYTPQIVTADDVRDFFNPRLTESEYPERQLIAKIKSAEYFVNSKYSVSLLAASTAEIEAVKMIIASRIGSEPRVLQKRMNLTREAWVTEKQASEGHDPLSISQGWEKDAIDMLRKNLPNVRGLKIVNKSG